MPFSGDGLEAFHGLVLFGSITAWGCLGFHLSFLGLE